jgi:hypothetical protein
MHGLLCHRLTGVRQESARPRSFDAFEYSWRDPQKFIFGEQSDSESEGPKKTTREDECEPIKIPRENFGLYLKIDPMSPSSNSAKTAYL